MKPSDDWRARDTFLVLGALGLAGYLLALLVQAMVS